MGAAIQNQQDDGGNHRRRRRRNRPMSEINVTPFVDVMLVLLIIFMVAAPLSVVGIEVNMPDTQAAALPPDQEEPLTVSIAADGTLAIQTTETAEAELVAKLQAVLAERDSDRVFVRADAANSWDRVAHVMGLLNAAGFTNIGLVTDAATRTGSDG
ncbi:protein TolR [Loktanella sp. IMCC34160]|uniref:protein TolR n=1 Tax=Rhodobacterales TaxID=204455 RepID=UPI00101E0AE1|nr:protein TolR [Loktanella sp. IMCC34160]RYG90814.1 protein TolR [Loktanella sp. IMCC34160]